MVLAGFWAVIAFQLGNAPDARQAVIVSASDTVYETAIGEQSTVHLTDGTQLVLNTNSLVEVHYTNRDRLIRLERGEIHVQVAHDKARSLSVIAGDTIVRAVGTAFSLEIASNHKLDGRISADFCNCVFQ